jgi:hypothetical protein
MFPPSLREIVGNTITVGTFVATIHSMTARACTYSLALAGEHRSIQRAGAHRPYSQSVSNRHRRSYLRTVFGDRIMATASNR